MMHNEETGHFRPDATTEGHFSVTWKPEGKYFFHFTPETPDENKKSALKIAKGLHEWICTHGVKETLLVLGGDSIGDSINTHTGLDGEIITCLERLLGHKCHWLIIPVAYQ